MRGHQASGLLCGLVFVLTQAATGESGHLPSLAPGQWYQVPNSRLDAVLPDPLPDVAAGGPEAIMDAWSGGVYDTRRDQLVVTGGGHATYGGNEVYAFELATLRWRRLTDPSPHISRNTVEAFPDGTPASRHTFDGMEYLPDRDVLWRYGGVLWTDGRSTSATWEFALATGQWRKLAGAPERAVTPVTGYDPVTRQVFARWLSNWGVYDPAANRWTLLDDALWLEYQVSGVLDPVARKMLLLGDGKAELFDLTTGRFQPFVGSGCSSLIAAGGPGLEYDPVTGLVAAWIGGRGVWTIDLTTNTCQLHTAAGAVTPTGPAGGGSYGRFRYVPSHDLFIVVSGIHQNVFVYRRAWEGNGNGTPTPTPTPAPQPASPPVADTVRGFYVNALGREPSPAELESWAVALEANCNQNGLRAVSDAFFDSLEFRLTRSLTVRGLVGALYRALLGRDPDPAGLAFWADSVRQARLALATAFVESAEFHALAPWPGDRSATTNLLIRFYAEFLGRTPDPSGLGFWVDYVTTTADVAGTAHAFVASIEFETHALTFREYVTRLYRGILARPPDPEGLEAWEAVLRGHLLGLIDSAFVPSPEFAARVPAICR